MLPERPSPDGGEYVPAVSTSEEDEAWPGWDNNTVSIFSFVVLLELFSKKYRGRCLVAGEKQHVSVSQCWEVPCSFFYS